MTVVLRTAEEILEGAAHLKASSGEIVEEEDYLIQAETRPRRGRTGGKATQETTLLMAVPEATLGETPLTAAPVPHQGKQGFSGELAARGALGGEALCQGLHRLHTLTGSQLPLVGVVLELAVRPWEGKTKETRGILRAGRDRRLGTEDTGGTMLSGTRDQ